MMTLEDIKRKYSADWKGEGGLIYLSHGSYMECYFAVSISGEIIVAIDYSNSDVSYSSLDKLPRIIKRNNALKNFI